MTGLEKILEDIRAQAQETAQARENEAEEQAARVLAKAREEAQAERKEAQKRADEQAAALKERTVSAAALLRRQGLLAERQALISQTLTAARETAESLEAPRYFALLAAMAAHAAHPGEAGELCLSTADLDRLPEGFLQNLQEKLPQGASLSLCPEPAAIRSGFVLRYGGIEENGAFDAVFAARAEELQDRVRGILFDGE